MLNQHYIYSNSDLIKVEIDKFREEYELYYEDTERANRIPLPFETWRAKK